MKATDTYRLSFGKKIYRSVKAIVDFLIAFFALIVLSPLFVIVAIAIKADSRGPVFFVQDRIGKGEKIFRCVKFRSMSVDARHDIAGYEYQDVQAYVTKVGAFIRKYSIDELPQLFNVLTFKMSLIGYRPSQPSEKELNDARAAHAMYQIRPGISGWAQVNGRDVLAAHPTQKAEYDAYYLQHLSPWLDIKILFMTVIQVFKSDSVVEGVVTESKDDVTEERSKAEAVTAVTDSTVVKTADDECLKQKEVV